MMTRTEAVNFLIKKPYKFGRLLGFTKLTKLHNGWIIKMLKAKDDETLQAHRGSYKTTCVSIALALLIILRPNKRMLFMRKTDTDVKEIIKQVQNILLDPHTQVFIAAIYGVQLKLVTASVTEITTNLTTDVKGTAQLVGIGTGASLTGKHFDIIFTDDIVNVQDRISKAERDHTKIIYQELQNIKNRGGRIFNTGTPWHKEDAFSLMPDAEKWDYTQTNLISDEEIEKIKEAMIPSLFAANYELRHIASEDVIFMDAQTGAASDTVMNGIMHVDSAFYGEDYTAWGIMTKHDGKYYLYGRMKRRHVEDCYGDIMADYQRFLCSKLYNESNADKGFVARDLRKAGAKVVLYNEKENKYIKIVTHLKAIWKNLIFVDGTDPEYIDQICDYFEDAEHDDAPDDAACLARLLYPKRDNSLYKSLYM